jgi:hypothetical protein
VNIKTINKIFKELAKMDPAPVITVTARIIGKDKKYHLYRRIGVFGWWNGEECSFTTRKSENGNPKGTATLFRPFYGDDIVSVKITAEEELIASQNLLFELEERIREKK